MTGNASGPWRLGARTRKAVLLLHIASAGSWLGIDVVLGLLVLTAFTGDEVAAPAALVGIARFATWPLLTAGLLTLASGVLLGLGTKYGLIRYWWVLVKLVLNLVLVTLGVGLLAPMVGELSGQARASLLDGTPLPALTDLPFPPVVSGTTLLIAMTLSVFKPWGRIARRGAAALPAGSRRAPRIDA
jgi:uncharacterized membrane protein